MLLNHFFADVGEKTEVLEIGSRFTFIVTIMQLSGLPLTYSEAFVQFRFLNKDADAFATEPIKNVTGKYLHEQHPMKVIHSQPYSS